MIMNLWWLWALLSGVVTSIILYTNQICKMPSSLLMCYRGILMCVVLTPFAFFFNTPHNPWFWILGAIQGLIISYSDKRSFLCSRVYGGEITASIKPFVIAFVFVFWWVINPSQLLEMISNPKSFIYTIMCMIGITGSLLMIRRGNITNEAFKLMFPALICSVIVEANNKNITTIGAEDGLFSSIFWYCWITALFSGLPNFIKFLQKRDWKLIFVPKYVLGGCIVIVSVVIANLLKNTAMYYAANPAYVTALISLYPVWIIIWNKFYYRKKNTEKFPSCDIVSVILLLVSVIVLIFMQ